MKPFTHAAMVLAATLCAPAVFAQQRMDEMKGMDMPKKVAADAPVTHHASGVVKKLDTHAGTVTFAHKAVPSMNWPAMTMGFQAADKAMLDKLAVGQKVNFDFVRQAKGFVVTAIR